METNTTSTAQDELINNHVGIIDLESIEKIPFDHLVKSAITTLEAQIHPAKVQLDSFSETTDTIVELLRLVDSVQRVIMNFEFTLAVLSTSTQEEIAALKRKFSLIAEDYQNVTTKDDLASVPAKYAVYVVINKLCPKLKKTLDEAFKKGAHGEIKIVDTRDTLVQVQITKRTFDYTNDRYHYLIAGGIDNLFKHEKNSPVWQDLIQFAIFKDIVTEEEITAHLTKMGTQMNLGFNLVKEYKQNKNTWRLSGPLSVARNLAYYATHRDKIQSDALYNQLNAKLDDLVTLWNLAENPILSKLMTLRHPKIGHDELIFLPKLFPRITKDVILQEYQEDTINKINPLEISAPSIYGTTASRDRILRELSTPGEDKVPVRIFAAEPLNYRDSSQKETAKKSGNDETAIVIHIHGGGFIALSSLTHKAYLGKWVQNLKLVHFGIDYRLAPKHPYPESVDDVWQAYLWIVNYAENVLGIKTAKVIISGDSAGGNFALSLMLRLIRAGLNPPHGCLLIYPSLHMSPNRSSPSRFLHFEDPILPSKFMTFTRMAYMGDKDDIKFLEDPFISPLVASDELLAKLPPIRISIGTRDPLHDDCWLLLQKLKYLNRDAKMIVYDKLPHGFMMSQDLKNYAIINEDHCNMIRELIATD